MMTSHRDTETRSSEVPMTSTPLCLCASVARKGERPVTRSRWFVAVLACVMFPSLVGAQTETIAYPRDLPIAGAARLKDVASLQGATDMPLVGYGLVVGLNKT